MNKKRLLLSFASSIVLLSNIDAKGFTTLDEIIVTAQKTKENISDIPISINVLDDMNIEDSNINDVNDLEAYIPNFVSIDMGDSSRYIPVMRGLSAESRTFFTNVATYVDGVPYLDSMGNNVLLEDIKRVEVLKGPQGTLYGKNAYAGVINIITKKPTNETKSKIKLDLGEDNKRVFSINSSGAIIKNKLYMGILARHYEKDGYIKNNYLNGYDNDTKEDFAKLHFRYTPNENLELSLISSYLKKDDGATSVVSKALKNPREVNSDQKGFNKPKQKSLALKMEYKNKNYLFSSITSYKKQDENIYLDYDWTNQNLANYTVAYPFKNYNQEFRLDSRYQNIDYTIGLNLYKDEKSPMFKYNGFKIQDNTIKSNSIGLFTHLKYKLNEKLSLISGLRYDKDKVKLDDKIGNDKQEKTYNEISPKFAFMYDLKKDISTYINISKGYKSGGYFMFAPKEKKAYGKESLWNYELGFKSKLLDNRLNLNGSIFYMDIKDMQVMNNTDLVNGYITNAASVTSKGVELDASYILNDNFLPFFNIGVNDTKFDNYKDSIGDYSGNYNPYASKYNYTLGIKYRDENNIFANLELTGKSSFYTDKLNTNKIDGYHLLNSKIGYEKENFNIYLYGKNITNKKYDTVGYIDNYTVVSAPREVGIQLTYKF